MQWASIVPFVVALLGFISAVALLTTPPGGSTARVGRSASDEKFAEPVQIERVPEHTA